MTSAIISIIILVVVVVLFVTRLIPNPATAVLGCLLFVLTGVSPLKEAFSGFSNSIVLLMFGMMVVGIAMEETGVAALIGHKVAKLSGHKERLFILLAGLTSAALSTFLSNTAVIAIFLPLIASIARSEPNMKRMNLTLPVTMGAMFGGVCTLVGSTPQLTANGILQEMTGKEIGMFDYTLPGVVILAVYIVYVTLIGPRVGARVWGNRAEGNTEDSADAPADLAQPEVKKSKMIIILVIFLLTIVSYVLSSIESIKWIDTATTAICAALLCIITRSCSVKNVIKKMDWSVVFVLAGCLGIASGITNGGAGELMANGLSAILGENVPPRLSFAVIVLATMIISNFITNSTAVVIVLPIALSLCSAYSLNPAAFTLGIVFAANLTYSTPLANAQTAMTLVAGYRFSDYIRYTWPLALMVYAAINLIVPVFYPLVLK